MTLKRRLLFTLLAVFLASGLVSIVINEYVILPSFSDLERAEAEKNTQRVIEALNHEIQGLASTVSTWGWWDDTFQFVDDHNAGFATTNLSFAALAGPQVDFIAVYDVHGRRVGASANDSETSAFDAGELGAIELPSSHPLLRHSGPRSGIGGLLATRHGPLLVVSWPIRKSNGDGPTRGSCIMVRRLSTELLARLSTQTKLHFTVTPVASGSDTRPVVDRQGLDQKVAVAHGTVQLTEKSADIIGSTRLTDVHHQAVLELRVSTPTDISARGLTAVRLAQTNLGVSSLALLAILLGIVQRTLFKPMALLTSHVVALGAHSSLHNHNRLNLRTKDEFGTLAAEFDRMTDRLAEAHHKLAQQSFDSGRADMAAGVLHNIGNAITPLGVRLANMRSALSAIPYDHIARALTELKIGTADGQRQIVLNNFLRAACEELAHKAHYAAEQTQQIVSQLGHVQQILTDQESFSRTRQNVEQISLLDVLEQSYADLSPDLQEIMRLEIDPSVAQVGSAHASWVAVRQVVSNLLLNAAEALSTVPDHQGLMQVTCTVEEEPAGRFVRLVFTDNGNGIDPAALSRVFESGYSTKNRGSGTGLHWCANAVNAMHGRLYADSAGIGQGASFYLLLPTVEQPDRALKNVA